MNSDLDNRWSDAARQAALSVRRARAMMANPRKANPVVKKGKQAPKPSVYAGASPTFDERMGKRNNTEMSVWVPPPDSPYWKDPKFVESFNKGIADQNKKKLLAANALPKPNIFYSSTGPKGPLDRQTPQGILRWDPKNPVDASKLGYNMGTGKKYMPPMPPRGKGGKNIPRVETGRVIIGGKRYTRVGNMLVPDEKAAPGQMTKTYYMKG